MSILIPDHTPMPAALYRLRWRMEFSNGKVDRRGIWDNATTLASDSAWAVNKEGLAVVIIEGEDRFQNHGEVTVFVACPHDLYASMQWEAYSKVFPFSMPDQSVMLHSNIAGLSILTADEKITAWRNGQVTRAPLTEYDKLWKIHEHSLGGA